MNGDLVYLGGRGYMIFLCRKKLMNVRLTRALLAVTIADFMIADLVSSQWVTSDHLGLFISRSNVVAPVSDCLPFLSCHLVCTYSLEEF